MTTTYDEAIHNAHKLAEWFKARVVWDSSLNPPPPLPPGASGFNAGGGYRLKNPAQMPKPEKMAEKFYDAYAMLNTLCVYLGQVVEERDDAIRLLRPLATHGGAITPKQLVEMVVLLEPDILDEFCPQHDCW